MNEIENTTIDRATNELFQLLDASKELAPQITDAAIRAEFWISVGGIFSLLSAITVLALVAILCWKRSVADNMDAHSGEIIGGFAFASIVVATVLTIAFFATLPTALMGTFDPEAKLVYRIVNSVTD